MKRPGNGHRLIAGVKVVECEAMPPDTVALVSDRGVSVVTGIDYARKGSEATIVLRSDGEPWTFEENPLLDLWRQADDQWAREWVAAREQLERWTLETAKMILEEAYEMRLTNYANLRCADPREYFDGLTRVHDPTGDGRHGDWEYGRVERW